MTLLRCLWAALFLGSGLLYSSFAGPDPANEPPSTKCDRPIFVAPDGKALGCIDARAPVQVEEHVPGWVRIRVEGWIPEEDVARLKAPAGKSAISGSVIDAAGKPAAGSMARLVSVDGALDRSVAAVRERHEASRKAMSLQIEELDEKLESALFSSDNLLEAKMNQIHLRDEKRALQQQIQALNERSAQELLKLYERYQIDTVTADANGFFLIEGVQPGAYQLLLISDSPISGPSWLLPVNLVAGQRQSLNLSGKEEHEDPFSPFR